MRPITGNQVMEEENLCASFPGRGIIVNVLVAVIKPLIPKIPLPRALYSVHLTPQTVPNTLHRIPYTVMLGPRLDTHFRKCRHFIEYLECILHDLHGHSRPRPLTKAKIQVKNRTDAFIFKEYFVPLFKGSV